MYSVSIELGIHVSSHSSAITFNTLNTNRRTTHIYLLPLYLPLHILHSSTHHIHPLFPKSDLNPKSGLNRLPYRNNTSHTSAAKSAHLPCSNLEAVASIRATCPPKHLAYYAPMMHLDTRTIINVLYPPLPTHLGLFWTFDIRYFVDILPSTRQLGAL